MGLFGPDQGGAGQKVDAKIVLCLAGLGLCALLASVGDRVVFGKKPPTNWGEAVLSYLTVFGYNVLGDRVSAFAFATMFWVILIGGIGFVIFTYVSEKVIEPMMIKRKIAALKREKELINRFDDGTI